MATVVAPETVSSSLLSSIEAETRRVGLQLFQRINESQPRFWQRAWWEDQLLAFTMRDEALKVELFRFVDALPMLTSATAVLGHLRQYVSHAHGRLPERLAYLVHAVERTPLLREVVAQAVKWGAGNFARKFIAGANTADVLNAARRERDRGRLFTLDILGEAVITNEEAEHHASACMELLETATTTARAWPAVSALDDSWYGPQPRVNVSIKLSALDAKFDPLNFAGTQARLAPRLREIFRTAQRTSAFVNVDMESYEKKDLTLHLFMRVLEEPEFREWTHVGIVVQCYLRDAERDLRRLLAWVRQRGAPVWVRLVKGAYWDYETINAQSRGWPIPVFQKKWESDANYERLSLLVLRHHTELHPAFGSHNVRSLAHVVAAADRLQVPPSAYELQMLYGMADAEKEVFVRSGQRLRVYMPFGELIPGMAYLVRRLLENTSNNSFLRAGFLEHASAARLLEPPGESPSHASAATKSYQEPTSMIVHATSATFINEPPVDFSQQENRNLMQGALDAVRPRLGRHFPLVIGGQTVETPERIVSRNPSDMATIVGTSGQAEAGHIDTAVNAAERAGQQWRALGAAGRAKLLVRAAELLQSRLFEISAWEIFECGKTWREATADVEEAIDFLRYYADQAQLLEQPRGADVPGEQNRFEYLPRGVVAVIAPWNFPLAILTGMTSAALATGNTVIMKPAESAVCVAGLLQEVFLAAGVPAGVVNFLPGEGSTVGAGLVEHPRVAMIAFTGSREVGLMIHQRAAALSPRLSYVKHVVAELGGKNAIIVDDSADLDEAVLGVMKSAFGYQGQKCSACSRAIVLPRVYDAFVPRLIAAVKSLHVGPAEEPGTDIGPVIDAAALAKVREYIEIGRTEGKELLSVDVGAWAERGNYVGPHIFGDVSPNARLAQEEVFGPVLAIVRAQNFAEALSLANGTSFALTGGVYSRTPEHLELAKREFAVGNLYLNRPITGAIVGRHPFGGFKMSGLGSKAGGPDYLLQYVIPRVVTENTLRRGFAPQENS